MEKMIQRINELTEIIKEANLKYYTEDNPIMTDREYDRYYQELLNIERKYPELKQENSPTSNVGGITLEDTKKVIHEKPMLSLSNVFNIEELNDFIEKTNSDEFAVEPKIDGLAVTIHYVNGKLQKAATRGNGLTGEDITHNANVIKDIPKELKNKLTIEVRGEIYMKKSVFNKINKARELAKETLFANPRNAAAGSVRQLRSEIAKKRELSCFIYQIVEPEKYYINKQSEALEFIKKEGFQINENSVVTNKISEIKQFIENIIKNRDQFDYEIDGVVIKVNDIKKQEKIGYIANAPKWATAYKFPTEEAITKLIDIFFTIGRTGQITPNAKLEPVKIMGSTINYATLHNEDYIKKRDLRIGDFVRVTKAGEIIPEVIDSIKERRTGKEKKFKMISNCPICKEQITRKDDESAYYCLNENCDAKIIEILIHFASKSAMDIEGLGEKIIEELYNLNYLRHFSDIYKLKDHYTDLIELGGYGKKSIDNLIESIEKSKQQPFSRLLFALGIRQVGIKTANILAKEYINLDNLINAKYEDLIKIHDIGEITAKNIINHFLNEKNIEEINRLKEHELQMKENQTKIKENIYTDKTIVITGSFSNYNRREIKEKLESFGAKITGTVSSKTDYIIVGKKPGSKYTEGLKLNKKIINEIKLEEIMQSK